MNNRVHFGVYASSDLFFGTEYATDPYIGKAKEMHEDLAKYGRQAFHVVSLQAFTNEEEAFKALERYRPLGNYRPNIVRTEEYKQAKREAYAGENAPRFGDKQPEEAKRKIAAYRATTMWINNGDEERVVSKSEPIPEGWARGRNKSLRTKVSKGMRKNNSTPNPT